jgi:hypothetical protein
MYLYVFYGDLQNLFSRYILAVDAYRLVREGMFRSLSSEVSQATEVNEMQTY